MTNKSLEIWVCSKLLLDACVWDR